ncbi:efflux RND transporter permease subunit [Parahaliea aestuarii]|uniref:Efflux RND transporter permease subunit n=1 Tax=Parahaliea aestuarii TaxID=1852021 RepID=A0A5C8ZNB4_9GAMM|nr:efflux RND transporter permease subunit [Parahaliea aestuarii]TXS89996.1 efflux RND transporter permease subunit [Parahaliea aestuarii]
MKLSNLSVQRPVFATVLALLLAVFGVMAFTQLSTREYPDVTIPAVSVSTTYRGAAADVVESRITQVLEDELGGIEGVRAIRSSSIDGRSNINIEFNLSRDLDAAANDVRDKVSRALGRLPEEAESPTVSKADSDASPIVFISVESSNLPQVEVVDYAERYLRDRFAALDGVASVNTYGGGARSMRIWIDRHKLNARRLSIGDVMDALQRENIELPAGLVESTAMEFPLRLQRAYHSEQDFRQLVITRGEDGHLVRLGEVARVALGSEDTRRLFITNGRESMALGVVKQSNANTVEVLDAVHREIEAIRQDLPEGMGITPSGDASAFIRSAIGGVYWTLLITTALVALVIFLFLGAFRATLVPVVCIPLSLLAGCIALLAFGYSINLITLLAMVLAIGLVVDDAIVVLENIHRRIEEGEPPLLAASRGASQVGFAVVATTAVILAVFSPIVFMEDMTGRLFSELAVAISVSVIASSVLALSLVPMLCSKLMRAKERKSWLHRGTERFLDALARSYRRSLEWSLRHPLLMVGVVVLAVLLAWHEAGSLQLEQVPVEDQDSVMVAIRADTGTNVNTMRDIIAEMQAPLLERQKDGTIPRVLFVSPSFRDTTPDAAFARVSLVSSTERDFSAFDMRNDMVGYWRDLPGVSIMTFLPAGLGQRGASTPVEFVLQGPDYNSLADWRDTVVDAARDSGLFGSLDSDLRKNQQQLHVKTDLARAAALGVSAQELGEALQALMAEQEATTFSDRGEEYPVIVQLEPSQRSSPDDIRNVFVRGDQGELVQLANLLSLESVASIPALHRYNRMRAVTIEGSLAPGVALGDALAFLENVARSELPVSAKVDYKGESLNYKESTGAIYATFGMALLVTFLVMAAQFESFVHPTIIMVTVPLAIVGGLAGLVITGQSFNIFSQIGLLMLIGIATKNGILLVEFINQLRDEGREFREAIVDACGLRLRPVLMTTVSTLVGALPLLLMTGPGSASRNVLGAVILFGVATATLFTLYVVPGLYNLLARRTGSPGAIAREMQALEARH